MFSPIIRDLLYYGISVALVYDKENDKVGFLVEDFYKSGAIILWETEYGFEAHARYNEVTEIRELDDIIQLHIKWFERSKDKYEGWSTIAYSWKKLISNYQEEQ